MYYYEAVNMISKLLKLTVAISGLVFFSACSKKTQNRVSEVQVDHEVEKIVGGSEVASSTLANNLFVMIVSDNNGVPQVCTGIFISTHHILTAAHCVQSSLDNISLVTGVKPLTEEQGTVLTAVKVYSHEKYNEESIMERNDIAVIKIAESVGLKESQLPKLPDAEVTKLIEQAKNINFVAVGYGKTGSTEEAERSEGVLRTVRLKSNFKNTTVMKVDQTDGHGVCYGDSGGPALKLYKNTQYVIGVAAGIYNKNKSLNVIDECQRGSLYMNIVPHLDWIRNKLSE